MVQYAPNHFGHGVALLVVEPSPAAEHAASNAPIVPVDQVLEDGATRAGGSMEGDLSPGSSHQIPKPQVSGMKRVFPSESVPSATENGIHEGSY